MHRPNAPQNRWAEAVASHLEHRPGQRAVSFVSKDGRRDLSFAELADDCDRFRAAYDRFGVAPGGTVLIFLRHVPELYGSFLGAMLSGHIPAMMPCSSPRQEPAVYWHSHDALLKRIRPAAIVADDATLAEMHGAGLPLDGTALISIDGLEAGGAAGRREPPPGAATALLQHSSGTTGLKKGVRLSFDAIERQIESYAGAIGMGEGDSVVSWLPLYHDMGLVACMLMPLRLGLPVTHIDPFHWLARPDLLLELLGAAPGAFCWLPNFAFDHLTLTVGRRAADFDLGGVRAFINCSEPCRPATFRRFAETFAPAGLRPEQLQCCYAMAETVFAAAQTAPSAPVRTLTVSGDALRQTGRAVDTAPDALDAVELLESGGPIDGIRIEIRDEGRRALPERQVGEIAISGAFLFEGYNAEPERTAACLADGVYHSGDLGFLADGRLYVLGRKDDLMIVNGRNIYAHEVEEQLAGTPGVKPGRVVALAEDDARIGSSVMIVIAERAAGAEDDPGRIRRDVIDRIFSVFQVTPRQVEVVDEGWLIKTTSGKIARAANLAKLRGAPAGDGREDHAGR